MCVPLGLRVRRDVLDGNDLGLVNSFIESLEFKPADIFRGLTNKIVQFGRLYDYRKKTCEYGTTPFPHVLNMLATYIEDGPYNQCIVKRFDKGKTDTACIDSCCFGGTVGVFTFGKETDVVFTRGSNKHVINVTNNSLYTVSGEARYAWKRQPLPIKSGTYYSIEFHSVKP